MHYPDYLVTIGLKNDTTLFVVRVQGQPGGLAAMSMALNIMRSERGVEEAPVNELLINVEKL